MRMHLQKNAVEELVLSSLHSEVIDDFGSAEPIVYEGFYTVSKLVAPYC